MFFSPPSNASTECPRADIIFYRGVLNKRKNLITMAVALGAGCRNCVLGQAMGALDLGATKEEMLETITAVRQYQRDNRVPR